MFRNTHPSFTLRRHGSSIPKISFVKLGSWKIVVICHKKTTCQNIYLVSRNTLYLYIYFACLSSLIWCLFVSNKHQRWNLKNLSRGLNSPKSAETRFKFSAGLNLETFDMEPTIFKPRLKFKPPLKFFKFGHWTAKPIGLKFCVGPYKTPRKVIGWSKFQKLASNEIRFTLNCESPRNIFIQSASFVCFCFTMFIKQREMI